MTERAMNSIVKSNYPASKLPEDLRTGMDPASTVTVIITVEERRPEHVLSLEEIFAQRRPPFRSAKEIDEAVRRDRDAWND
jgi:hypothetical protein